jgi:creatinine amidohydrolase
MPIYGVGDLGLGLAWQAEASLAATLLAESIRELDTTLPLVVLPANHLSLAPYQPALSAIDPDAFREAIMEQALGIKTTGVNKLAFWSSHPWNTEIIDVISRDVRIELDLQTFVVELGGLDLSLHPRFPEQRARAGHLAACIGGSTPETATGGGAMDPGFRPGNWQSLPPVQAYDGSSSPETLIAETARRLAGLWHEIWQRPALNGNEESAPLSSAPPAAGQIEPPRPCGLADHTTTQLAELPHDKNPWVVIPVGAIEQHGPHLPVGVDTMIAEAAADGLKSRLGETIEIAPTLAYGKSNEHADFRGTVGISARSLRRLVKSRVQNLRALGFTRFALLNTHGGNSSVLTYTLRELQSELDVRAGMLRLPVSDELDEQERTWGFHAGEWETSVMLEIAPELVKMDRAVSHYPARLEDEGELRPENAPAIFSWKTADIAPAGVMGDATKASAEKGRRWLNFAIDQLAGQIRQLG